MLAGAGIFQREPQAKAAEKEGPQFVDSVDFNRSKLGQQEFARQYRWQSRPPPQNLGATAHYDERFAQVYNERSLEPGWDRHIQGRNKPAPMWADTDYVLQARHLQHTNNFWTHGSDAADLRLSRVGYTTSPPQISSRSLVSIFLDK